MHVVPEALKRPNKQRLGSEKMLKWLNKIVLAIQLGCVLYAIASLSVANDKTFTNDIWGTSKLKLNLVVEVRTSNCTWNNTMTYGPFKNIPDQVGPENLLWRLSQLAYSTKTMIGVACFGLFVGIVNRILFDLNMHKFQHMDFIIRKDILTAIEVFTSIFVIIAATGVDSLSNVLKDYFQFCGITSDNTLPFNAPYGELYFGESLGLFSYVICAILHVYNGQRSDLLPPQPSVEPSEVASIDEDDEVELAVGPSVPPSTREAPGMGKPPVTSGAPTGGHLAPDHQQHQPAEGPY